jgi:hypothetical protein
MKLDDESVWFGVASAALLVMAAAIRFQDLGVSLFEDEVWVAELVRHGGWTPHSQATPPLFYFLCRAWTSLRGVTDVTLREPAAFFGVALTAVPLFAPLPRLSRFVWSAALAFSSPLLFYSTRLKQYTLEAFVAAVLLVLFLRWWGTRSRGMAALLFVIAAIGVTGLHATVIVLGAMALVCITRPRMLIGFAAVFALWALAYWGWLEPGTASTALHGDMDAFFAMNGRWVTSPRLLLDGTMHWLGQSLNLVRFWWLGIALPVVVWLVRERNAVVPLLALLPVLAVAVASALHLYPYGEVRLMIFAFPGLFLLIASAIGELARRVPLLLLLLVPFVWSGIARDPYNRTYMRLADLRPMFATIAQSGGPVYADPSFAAPLRYYHPALDIRAGTLRAPAGAGWYVQRASTFTPSGASVVLREGAVVAARVGS